jgi:hypothetical protein
MNMSQLEKKLRNEKKDFSIKASSDFSSKLISKIESQKVNPEQFNNKVSMMMRTVAILLLSLGGIFYYSHFSNIETDLEIDNQIVMNGNGLIHNPAPSLNDLNIKKEVELLKKDLGGITSLFNVYAEASFQ